MVEDAVDTWNKFKKWKNPLTPPPVTGTELRIKVPHLLVTASTCACADARACTSLCSCLRLCPCLLFIGLVGYSLSIHGPVQYSRMLWRSGVCVCVRVRVRARVWLCIVVWHCPSLCEGDDNEPGHLSSGEAEQTRHARARLPLLHHHQLDQPRSSTAQRSL
jgi:hypothetical protein